MGGGEAEPTRAEASFWLRAIFKSRESSELLSAIAHCSSRMGLPAGKGDLCGTPIASTLRITRLPYFPGLLCW